ncbi:MAG: hypothetical protein AAF355_05960 [Myxococcota bacterium]
MRILIGSRAEPEVRNVVELQRRNGKNQTCVGCFQSAPAGKLGSLVRFAFGGSEPFFAPDLRDSLGGYGVYLHPNPTCIELAVGQGAFAVRPGSLGRDSRAPFSSDVGLDSGARDSDFCSSRDRAPHDRLTGRRCGDLGLRNGLSPEVVEVRASILCDLLFKAVKRRLGGLLNSANGGDQLAIGTSRVDDSLGRRTAEALIFAADAAGCRAKLIRQAERISLPVIKLPGYSKAELGRVLGRKTVGVAAILDDKIAKEVSRTVDMVAALSEDG